MGSREVSCLQCGSWELRRIIDMSMQIQGWKCTKCGLFFDRSDIETQDEMYQQETERFKKMLEETEENITEGLS